MAVKRGVGLVRTQLTEGFVQQGMPLEELLSVDDALGRIEALYKPYHRALRRLIYCGEWIESHALHVFLLHLPDFLGMPDAVALAEAGHRDTVQAALRIRKLGNALMRVIGGREIHPVNLKVGGFWRAPDAEALQALLPDIGQASDAMLRQLDRLTRLAFPDFTVDCEFLALRHDEEYAITEGRLVSSRGIDLPLEGYDGLLTETHVRHSTALQSQRSDGGTPVHVGPLARLHLNRDRLPPDLGERRPARHPAPAVARRRPDPRAGLRTVRTGNPAARPGLLHRHRFRDGPPGADAAGRRRPGRRAAGTDRHHRAGQHHVAGHDREDAQDQRVRSRSPSFRG